MEGFSPSPCASDGGFGPCKKMLSLQGKVYIALICPLPLPWQPVPSPHGVW